VVTPQSAEDYVNPFRLKIDANAIILRNIKETVTEAAKIVWHYVKKGIRFLTMAYYTKAVKS
jgi:hypothetical protein